MFSLLVNIDFHDKETLVSAFQKLQVVTTIIKLSIFFD